MIQFSGFGIEEHSTRERRDHESASLRRLLEKGTETEDAEEGFNSTSGMKIYGSMGAMGVQGKEKVFIDLPRNLGSRIRCSGK
jgi:hypothetical protein